MGTNRSSGKSVAKELLIGDSLSPAKVQPHVSLEPSPRAAIPLTATPTSEAQAAEKVPVAKLIPAPINKSALRVIALKRRSRGQMWLWIVSGAVAVLLFAVFLFALGLFSGQEPRTTANPTSELPAVAPLLKSPEVKKSSPILEPPQGQTADLFAVGVSGEWIGELERIWGTTGNPGELHFSLRLDTPLHGDSHIEVFVNDEGFAREVLDYETTEERTEVSLSPTPGDDVSVAGVVASPTDIRYRITPRATPLVRLVSIERVGQPDSRAVLSGPRRVNSSFRHPPDSLALIDVLRVHPREGASLTLDGKFQGWVEEAENVLVSLGLKGRAAEVHFAGTNFAHYAPGDRVEVTATTTGKYFRRVVNNVVLERPYFLGARIRRPGVSDDDVPPNTPSGLASLPRPSAETAKPSPLQSPLSEESRAQTSRPTTSGVTSTDRSASRGSEIFVVSEEGQAALLMNGRWLELHLPSSLPAIIKCAYVDTFGTCWFGGEGGVTILDGRSIRTCAFDNNFPRETISCIHQDRLGGMWVGSWGDGIAYLEDDSWRTRDPGVASDKDRWKQFKRAEGLCRDDVNAMAEDGAGRLWIGTNNFDARGDVPPGGGISILLDDRFQHELLPDSIARLQIQSMIDDEDGRVYVGFIGGLLIVEPDQKAKVIGVDQGLPQRTPQALYLDSRGRLWAGTWGGGVVGIDRRAGNALKELALPEARQVRRLCEDANGTVWAGAIEGLWKLDEKGWQSVTLPSGIQKLCVVAAIPKEIASQLLSVSSEARPVTDTNADPSLPAAASPPPGNEGENSRKEESSLPDAMQYLSENGQLRSILRLEDSIETHHFLAGRHFAIIIYRGVEIQKTGQWKFEWRVTGADNSGYLTQRGADQGELTATQLAMLAETLAKHDLLHLPRRGIPGKESRTDPSAAIRTVRFRYRSKVYSAVIPEKLDNGDPNRMDPVIERYRSIAQTMLLVSGTEIDVNKGVPAAKD